MSVSKWSWREECDKDYCPGDCDNCPRAESEDDDGQHLTERESLLRVQDAT